MIKTYKRKGIKHKRRRRRKKRTRKNRGQKGGKLMGKGTFGYVFGEPGLPIEAGTLPGFITWTNPNQWVSKVFLQLSRDKKALEISSDTDYLVSEETAVGIQLNSMFGRKRAARYFIIPYAAKIDIVKLRKNILDVYNETWLSGTNGHWIFDLISRRAKSNFQVVSEAGEHDLKHEAIRLDDIAKVMRFQFKLFNILEALQLLQHAGFIFGEFKNENCVVAQDGTFKIIDLGSLTHISRIDKTQRGHIFYALPTSPSYQTWPPPIAAMSAKLLPERHSMYTGSRMRDDTLKQNLIHNWTIAKNFNIDARKAFNQLQFRSISRMVRLANRLGTRFVGCGLDQPGFGIKSWNEFHMQLGTFQGLIVTSQSHNDQLQDWAGHVEAWYKAWSSLNDITTKEGRMALLMRIDIYSFGMMIAESMLFFQYPTDSTSQNYIIKALKIVVLCCNLSASYTPNIDEIVECYKATIVEPQLGGAEKTQGTVGTKRFASATKGERVIPTEESQSLKPIPEEEEEESGSEEAVKRPETSL